MNEREIIISLNSKTSKLRLAQIYRNQVVGEWGHSWKINQSAFIPGPGPDTYKSNYLKVEIKLLKNIMLFFSF